MQNFKSLFALSVIALSPLASHAANVNLFCQEGYRYLGSCYAHLELNADNSLASAKLGCFKGSDETGNRSALQDAAISSSRSSGNTSVSETSLGKIVLYAGSQSLTLTANGSEKAMSCIANPVESDDTNSEDVLAEDNCATALTHLNGSVTHNTKVSDLPFRGFANGAYQEGVSSSASVVLSTRTSVVLYSETSDIGAILYSCDKATGKISEILNSHVINCQDLPKVNAAEVLYSACK